MQDNLLYRIPPGKCFCITQYYPLNLSSNNGEMINPPYSKFVYLSIEFFFHYRGTFKTNYQTYLSIPLDNFLILLRNIHKCSDVFKKMFCRYSKKMLFFTKKCYFSHKLVCLYETSSESNSFR